MKHRPTLGQVTHVLMIATLCFALWKLLVHDKVLTSHSTYKSGDHVARTIWNTMPDAKRSLLIIDREGCAYCRASMPFYARLAQAAEQADVEVISVTPDDKTAHQRYFEENHVHVNRIVRLADTPLSISATPTVIVLNQSKVVLGAWVGELTSEDESKVLHVVRLGFL